MGFNFGSDLLFSLHAVGPLLDAIDPDLRPLHRHGAKLIVYHGFSDPDISPLNSINYFESVVNFMAHRGDDQEDARERTNDFVRLFMIPGMQHCSGGPGPKTLNMTQTREDCDEPGQAHHDVRNS